jgi:hypothetical protein
LVLNTPAECRRISVTDLAALGERLMSKFEIQGCCCAATPGLQGVFLYRQEVPQPRTPKVYSSGIFILIIRRKLVYFDQRSFSYGGDTYFAVDLLLAMECEVFASPEEPVFALHVPVDLAELRGVVGAMGVEVQDDRSPDTLLGVALL